VAAHVNKKDDWAPPNEFDSEFSLFVDCTGLSPDLARLAEEVRDGKFDGFKAYVKGFAERLTLKKSDTDEFIVLKHAFFRYCFDFLYVHKGAFSVDPIAFDRFIEKCAFIASCSARSLGIPEHLLAPSQMDPSFLALARTTPSVREVSSTLSSIQFYVAPTDALVALQQIFSKLDELARTNRLERALGQFVQMVDASQGPKKMNFMSFDDCFSLFLAILAVDPPRNAVALCEFFDKAPNISAAPAAKYAMATFVTAVQHISDFSSDQLVSADRDAGDPLGLS